MREGEGYEEQRPIAEVAGAHAGGRVGERAATKATLRRALLQRRRANAAGSTAQAQAAAARSIRESVMSLLPPTATPGVPGGVTVAAYVSGPLEPPTGDLLDALQASGHRVLLPVLLPDDDLDWAVFEAATRLAHGRRGTWEPLGDRLGPTGIASADVVVVPGVAGGRDGSRLGRGGGSYDRALARARAGAVRVLLLWDGELSDALPRDEHDQRVDVIITPSTVLTITGS